MNSAAFASPAALGAASSSSLLTGRPLPSSRCCRPAARRWAVAPSPPRASATLGDKYGNLRGKKVPPVSDAVAVFTDAFGRPVPIVYRGLVNEVIVSTHLARVCAMWRYCKVFAFGIDEVFGKLMEFYPEGEGGLGSGGEKELLYAAVCKALDFDIEQVRSDAAEVRAWVEGKTEADVFAAAAAGEGPVGESLLAAKKGSEEGALEWYYSRMFGIGMLRVMEAVGAEMAVATADQWCSELGLPGSAVSVEMGSFLSLSERMKQAEQMFAEVAARDARKTAERLKEKAEKAKKKAEELEGEGESAVANKSETEPVASPVAAGDE